MQITTHLTFTSEFTIGLKKGYTNEHWTYQEVKIIYQDIQETLKKKENILLSGRLTQSEIIFLGQEEPSVTFNFINYPKFPLEKNKFQSHVIVTAKRLMKSLEQNRLVVIFDDRTIMLEITKDIDPDIKI